MILGLKILIALIALSVFVYFSKQKQRTYKYWLIGIIAILIGSIGVAYLLTYITFIISQY